MALWLAVAGGALVLGSSRALLLASCRADPTTHAAALRGLSQPFAVSPLVDAAALAGRAAQFSYLDQTTIE